MFKLGTQIEDILFVAPIANKASSVLQRTHLLIHRLLTMQTTLKRSSRTKQARACAGKEYRRDSMEHYLLIGSYRE